MNQGGMWESVFNRYFDQVYAYVAYRVAPDWDAAQDIAQEVFLGAFKSNPSPKTNGSVLSWLRGIARHKVADHFRTRGKGSGRLRVSSQAVSDFPAATDGDGADRAMRVSRALRELRADYAQLLEEKYIEGFSVRRMAADRRSSEKAVESALTRARAAFRQAYRHQQNTPSRQETVS